MLIVFINATGLDDWERAGGTEICRQAEILEPGGYYSVGLNGVFGGTDLGRRGLTRLGGSGFSSIMLPR